MSITRQLKPLPFFFISKEEANNRIIKYRETRYVEQSLAAGKDDTRTVWYSKQYLDELVSELNYLNADGLRVYFGVYPEDHVDFANQSCLIFVPTFFNEDRKHEDIILEDEANYADRPKPLREPMSFNYGSPCPSDCIDQEPKFPL